VTSIGANHETSAWGSVMEFHLYDQDCNICDPLNRQFKFEFKFEFKSLVFVVHICRHCKRGRNVAMEIIGDEYDEINTLTCWRNSDLSPAIRYGIYHQGYWDHECDSYYLCNDCGCGYAVNSFIKSGHKVFALGSSQSICCFSTIAGLDPELLGKRFCEVCFKSRVEWISSVIKKEVKSWCEEQMQERRERLQLRKLKKLFSQSKKSLRKTASREVLQSLKTEFEQVATLPE